MNFPWLGSFPSARHLSRELLLFGWSPDRGRCLHGVPYFFLGCLSGVCERGRQNWYQKSTRVSVAKEDQATEAGGAVFWLVGPLLHVPPALPCLAWSAFSRCCAVEGSAPRHSICHFPCPGEYSNASFCFIICASLSVL